MTLKTAEDNKRKHDRHEVTGDCFALLKTGNREVIGAIRDISAGGISLSYINEGKDINESSKISINLISENGCFENFYGRSIWSRNDESGFTSTLVKMKLCGIQFEELNKQLKAQLKKFLDSLNKK